MTLNVDLYYTMRSPYCYLATPQLRDLVSEYDLIFNLKPVFPLAKSDPNFFKGVNPLWPPYLVKDTDRIAKRLEIPFRWPPKPDPIVMDMHTLKVATEQPYIDRLTSLAQVAAERGLGLEFVISVSAMIFSPDIDGWDTGNHLAEAVADAGMELKALETIIANEGDRLKSAIVSNREQQLAAGHWGAPLFVFEGEIFFGRDRIDDLVWHLKNNGLSCR
ncbi:MAG: DsbA family protein [Pseudomonadales bacterium]|nr:DsbA family protein [Pseudomonadales bacterium]